MADRESIEWSRDRWRHVTPKGQVARKQMEMLITTVDCLLWGSTVGYPSDSLASWYYFDTVPTCDGQTDRRTDRRIPVSHAQGVLLCGRIVINITTVYRTPTMYVEPSMPRQLAGYVTIGNSCCDARSSSLATKNFSARASHSARPARRRHSISCSDSPTMWSHKLIPSVWRRGSHFHPRLNGMVIRIIKTKNRT